jgi:hypothetical protein
MFFSLWPGYAFSFLGVDVEEALISGVEEMFRSIMSLLVDQKDKLQAEQTLRKKNSIVLTAPSEPEDEQAQGSCCAI